MAGKVTFTGIAANYMVTIPDGKTARVVGGSSVTPADTVTTVKHRHQGQARLPR